jgi:hypothetical protein
VAPPARRRRHRAGGVAGRSSRLLGGRNGSSPSALLWQSSAHCRLSGWGCRSLRPSGLRSAQGLVTEGDAVAYVNGVLKTKAAEADMLRAQAAVNTARKIYA